jgi:magnesium-transporting ATPase (P-type)
VLRLQGSSRNERQ